MATMNECTFVLLGFNSKEMVKEAISEISKKLTNNLISFEYEKNAEEFFAKKPEKYSGVKSRFNLNGQLSSYFLSMIVDDFLFYLYPGDTPVFVSFPTNLVQLDCFIGGVNRLRQRSHIFVISMIEENKPENEAETIIHLESYNDVDIINVTPSDYIDVIKTISC